MRELLLVVLTAFITTITTLYGKALVMRITRLLSRFKRSKLSMAQRVDLLERRVKLHESKDGTYLNKFDELEELLNTRDRGRKDMVRREVREYLKELQK